MTPITQIILILAVALVAICGFNTLDNIFGKNNKDKGDEQ